MKRILYILTLVIAANAYAQQNAPQQQMEGKCWGDLPGYPYYYCECTNEAIDFAFPLQLELTDTMWYKATIDVMRQGLSAYWFSDVSVTFEVYAFCSSEGPTITMTVGGNRMKEMAVEEINRRLDEMGDMADMIGKVLFPRIRVYPRNGTGTVYCYPYDQGPRSTCENTLPLIPRMTYVCDTTEEVYELTPARINSYGRGFIHWKQKNNLPATIRLTQDSCNGAEMANVTLSDSLHVYVLDSIQMKAAKQAGRSIFVHVSHPEGYVGRLIYHNTLIRDAQIIDTTLCQGKYIQLPDTVLKETTYYPNDIVWVGGDTLSLTAYNLTVVPPTPQYDTLRLKASQLPRSYKNQHVIPANGWGDYDFMVTKKNQCDEHWLVHVEHKIDTISTVVNQTLCQGKTFTASGITYERDTVIKDSIWKDADTYEMRDITLHFTEPELEYDTVSIAPSKMTVNGYWYAGLGVVIKGYGDTLIVKKQRNQCTRIIQLHVDQDIRIIEGDTTFTTCMGKTIMIGSRIFEKDTTIYDTLLVDGDTWQAGNIVMVFTEPELEYDTVLTTPELPEGDTLLIVTTEGQCTRWIQMHVKAPEGLNEVVDPAEEKAYKYLDKGTLYIRRKGQDYDLLGRPIHRQ